MSLCFFLRCFSKEDVLKKGENGHFFVFLLILYKILEYLIAAAVYLFRGFVNERKMSVAEHQDKEQAYEEKLKALM